jgi:mannose-6-phosphate isomerase
LTAHRLESSIRHYAWGSRSAIADLLGRRPTGEPEAELWLGAHPDGPSRVVSSGLGLDAWIARDPLRALGEETSRRFAAQLPFLFKVLAAAEPLSLQAHPSREQAERGFAREEAAGVPHGAHERMYKDRNHKPELICALGRFSALCGFRPVEESLTVLASFGMAEPQSPLFDAWRRLRESPDASGLRRFFRGLFQMDEVALATVIDAGIARQSPRTGASTAGFGPWFARLAALHPRDPGILVTLLLNFVELENGQALYLPAGNLHAYLGGVALEIMASSDNVLRGGLTEKHVDVVELTDIVDFSPCLPAISQGELHEVGEGARVRRFAGSAADFELLLVDLDGGSFSSTGPAIVLGLEGRLLLEDATETFELLRGEQWFCDAASGFRLVGGGRVAVGRPNSRG